MRHLMFVIGCALAAFVDRLCGRGLAVNEAPAIAPAIPGTLPPETPVVTVGIPTNLDSAKILARKTALINAGTEPLLAEKLAIDAEQQQYLRDKNLTATATVETRPATETIIKIKTRPDGAPEDVDLSTLTVTQLTDLAAGEGYDLKGATKKADIIAAITAAAKCLVIAFISALFFGTSAPAEAAALPATPLAIAANSVVSQPTVSPIITALPNGTAPSVLLAYLQLDAVQWVEIICALALAFAACAWLPKHHREVERRVRRGLFRIGIALAIMADRLRGRALATNVVFTPQETSHGTASLLGDVAITFANAVVVRGSDDRHFKLAVDGSEIPLGILQRDLVDTGEANVVPKGIALFGLYPESLPAVAAAAIAADAELVVDIATPGRVKTLPTTPGVYYVIGRSRFTVASAGDPVSIEHQTPLLKKVGIGYVAGDGGAVTQITNSATGVTLNKLSGQITTVALTTAAGAEERFTVTNSTVAATDTIALGTTYNGAGTPMLGVVNVTAGTFDIVVTNLHASAALNALMVINFAVVKAVAA